MNVFLLVLLTITGFCVGFIIGYFYRMTDKEPKVFGTLHVTEGDFLNCNFEVEDLEQLDQPTGSIIQFRIERKKKDI